MPEAVSKQCSVGQPSQGIMQSLVGEPLLEGLVFGNVAGNEYYRLSGQRRDGALEPYIPTFYRQAILDLHRLAALHRMPDVPEELLGRLGG